MARVTKARHGDGLSRAVTVSIYTTELKSYMYYMYVSIQYLLRRVLPRDTSLRESDDVRSWAGESRRRHPSRRPPC